MYSPVTISPCNTVARYNYTECMGQLNSMNLLKISFDLILVAIFEAILDFGRYFWKLNFENKKTITHYQDITHCQNMLASIWL